MESKKREVTMSHCKTYCYAQMWRLSIEQPLCLCQCESIPALFIPEMYHIQGTKDFVEEFMV
jgi:hypothetical protein